MTALTTRSTFLPIMLVALGAGALYYGSIYGPPESSQVEAAVAALAPEQANVDPPTGLVLSPPSDDGPKVQIAILLDTSSSMNGLIDQARSELWTMVNAMDGFSKDGKATSIEIAIYEYGNSSLDAEGGFLRQVIPFSSDLDSISEALFSLTTGGGSEHAGQVIASATERLQWREGDNTVRAIYIAGNEGFEQGPLPFADAMSGARDKEIVVNTIFCGDEAQGRTLQWSEGAALGAGRYMAINHNKRAVHVAAPQDDEIARLGRELNETYVYYGSRGKSSYDNQHRQDNNAASAGMSVMVERSVSKSSRNYANFGWDLVDASTQSEFKISEVDQKTLPGEYRSMSTEELQQAVDKKSKRRKSIQGRLGKLQTERNDYIATKAKAAGQGATLNSVMIAALQEQASGLGFEFQ